MEINQSYMKSGDKVNRKISMNTEMSSFLWICRNMEIVHIRRKWKIRRFRWIWR